MPPPEVLELPLALMETRGATHIQAATRKHSTHTYIYISLSICIYIYIHICIHIHKQSKIQMTTMHTDNNTTNNTVYIKHPPGAHGDTGGRRTSRCQREGNYT